ncbi:hypothetical protein AN944_03065 [Shewanella sp. P1-14-1]|nr:hypothetical protein AN944_03065 [Shewanella sp. P1-14-1]
MNNFYLINFEANIKNALYSVDNSVYQHYM